MDETYTFLSKDSLAEIQALSDAAYSGLVKRWNAMYEVNEDFLARRERKFVDYIKDLFNTLEESEEQRRIQMIGQIDNTLEQFHKLKKDLHMDNESLPWKQEREPYTLFLQEIENEMKRFVDMKNSRLDKMASFRAKEKELCDLLEIDPIPAFRDPIPTDEQLDDVEMNIFRLREEKLNRFEFFKNSKSKIIELMKEMEYDIQVEFEVEILSSNEETFIPSTTNVNKLKELEEALQREYNLKLSYRDSLMVKLTKLWDKINVDQSERDTFCNRYSKVSKTHLHAINEEIARCEKIKLANIKPIILSLRDKIIDMWNQLKYSDEQRRKFTAIYTEHFSEDVLELHELELESLEHFYQKYQHIYQLAEKREELWQRMLHLEEIANDKSRLFTNRGGQLLKEEKERKKLEVNLPKVNSQLKDALLDFQRDEGQPFLWYGADLLKKIHDEWEERQAAKESKKLTRKVESRCGSGRPIEKRKIGTPISSARDAKTRRQDDYGSQTIILQEGLEKSELSVATPRSALKEVGNQVPGIGHSSPTLITPAGRRGTPASAFSRFTPSTNYKVTPSTSRKGTPTSAVRSGGQKTSAIPRMAAHRSRLHLQF